MPVLLGIDTSCDDTGIGIVRDGAVVANVVASQAQLHAPAGGVIPETASREHLTVIDAVLERALLTAGEELGAVTGVAATHGPGLVGALLVGLNYGKALAWGLDVPFYPIHHLEGHIASALAGGDVQPPFLCLVASGGHTSLFDVPAWGEYRELGRTRDDAAGEAFDKVARLLGLPYPGGPELAKLAATGDPSAVRLPAPMRGNDSLDFSFSGLKTAVATVIERDPNVDRADLAASFQRTVVENLVGTAQRALALTGRTVLVVVGGVAANSSLRERLSSLGVDVRLPPPGLSTDNGAMIALAAQARLLHGLEPASDKNPPLAADATPYAPLSSSAVR